MRLFIAFLASSFLALSHLARAEWHIFKGYNIAQCRFQGTTRLHAINSLLDHLLSNTPLVVSSAKLGIAGSPAYQTFFKSDRNLEWVTEIFDKITTGAKAEVLNHFGMTEIYPPTILCTDLENPATKNLAWRCQQHGWYIMQTSNSHRVVLCPRFWELGRAPTPKSSYCPLVVDNRFSPDNNRLIQNQYGLLVHALVNIYNQFSNESSSPKEVFKIQECADLSADRTIMNTNNYAFFASALRAGCTDFVAITNQPRKRQVSNESIEAITSDGSIIEQVMVNETFLNFSMVDEDLKNPPSYIVPATALNDTDYQVVRDSSASSKKGRGLDDGKM